MVDDPVWQYFGVMGCAELGLIHGIQQYLFFETQTYSYTHKGASKPDRLVVLVGSRH